MKALMDDFHLELSQLKTDQHALESELSSIRQKVAKFENTQTSSHLLDFNNIYNEFHDRITREQNILIFNVPDSAHELSSDSELTVQELLKDLSLSSIKIVHTRRLRNVGQKPRPFLLKLWTFSDVNNVLKSKSKLRHIDC
jgi:hypothetical protein